MRDKAHFLLFIFFVSLIGGCNTKTEKTASVPAVSSQKKGGVSVTRASGGSIQIPLRLGGPLNKGSSLSREWITFHDASLPADLVGTVGFKTEGYLSLERGVVCTYTAEYSINAKEPLSAIEVRFLSFDVWGGHQRSFSETHVQDIKAGEQTSFSLSWDLSPSENEAKEFYASIAYITRVRTQSGHIVEADPSPVLEEAQKFYKKFTIEDLEPKPEKK
jgi:hypothetical protein